MRLTFKEYLESKEKLLEAIKSSPVQKSSYNVSKYCKLVVFNEDQKQTILLKPGHQVIVEWIYDNLADPQPVNLQIEDIKNPMIDEISYTTIWKGMKLKEWLKKNTSETIKQ
jgi:hypothetical protein